MFFVLDMRVTFVTEPIVDLPTTSLTTGAIEKGD